MDLIMIIVNQKSLRKKVKKHFTKIGLGEFITMNSMGTFGMLTRDNKVRTSIDSIFDNTIDIVNQSKVIAVVNTSQLSTEDVIDEAYHIFTEPTKSFDTGIIFSIPINKLLD